MTMYTYSADTMRQIEKFVNENAIEKDDIINIMQDQSGCFVLFYYA